MNGTYEKFIDIHNSLDVIYALDNYEDYLTNEELQEIQEEGRYWDIIGFHLYILVDNDTLVVVDNEKDVVILGREHLPLILRDKYYEWFAEKETKF